MNEKDYIYVEKEIKLFGFTIFYYWTKEESKYSKARNNWRIE